MSKEHGAYLGRICDLRTLKERCWCDEHTGCWHLRSANGKPMPKDTRHTIWVSMRGQVPALRAAWEFYKGKPVHADKIVFRTCDSYDCVNPAHLRMGSRAEMGKQAAAKGIYKGQLSRILAGRANGEKRRKVSGDDRIAIAVSTEPPSVVAKRYGVSTALVWSLRKKAREERHPFAGSASIFAKAGAESSRLAAAA